MIIIRCYVELELENQIRTVFQNVIKRKSLTVARNSKNRLLILLFFHSLFLLCFKSYYFNDLLLSRYFHSLAKQVEETGQDSIDQELELSHFSSKTPVDRLGYPIVGGITNLGLEVC